MKDGNPIKKTLTMLLGERAQVVAERHMASCNLCADQQYMETFRLVAIHVRQLREASKGMDRDEANDFISTHLHAASIRSLIVYQEKFNELVHLVSQIEVVMTLDQRAEFDRLKAFMKTLN